MGKYYAHLTGGVTGSTIHVVLNVGLPPTDDMRREAQAPDPEA